jgi:RAD51-like protein 2
MIIYYRCHSYLQLIALSNILHKTISQHKICLIVVDGIAAPFRYGFKDINLRHRLLSGLAQNFVKLASRFKLGVVFTNHMTTSSHASMDGSSHLVPALGESWAHVCTTRVVLYWDGLDRKAYLYKSPSLSEGAVVFKITKDGIRDDGGEASIGRIELEKEMLTRADDTVPTIKRARYSECR